MFKTALLICFLTALLMASESRANTFVVNSIFDTPDTNPGDGVCEATTGGVQCTLRAAIEETNALSGRDIIRFEIGPITLNISGSPLPSITDNLLIDGRTATAYNTSATSVADAPPSIYLNGLGLSSSTADGLRLINGADFSEIRAIGITGFPNRGIEVSNCDNVTMDGNWIGTARNGALASNGDSGIYIDRCENCTVGRHIEGSTLFGLGNVISNNLKDGVFITLGSNNLVGGNYIGVDVTGGLDHGNGRHGVYLNGPNHRVGSVSGSANAGNFIWNNAGNGIFTDAGGHLIHGNNIGSNKDHGISVNGSGTAIGSSNSSWGNFIVANDGHGVMVGEVFSSSSNEIKNNRIIDNAQHGIYVSQGNNSTVTFNSIYKNTQDAIRIDTSENSISSNSIGWFDGVVHGNGGNGVLISNNGSNNEVLINLMAGVDGNGIYVDSGSGNQLTLNNIGTATNGEDWGNGASGIRIGTSASNTTIIGNQIGSNALDGIDLEGSGNDICQNYIGVTPDGLVSAGNAIEGIRVEGDGNRIGDVSAGCDPNFLGNNGSDGIQVHGQANIIRNNFIGRLGANNFGNSRGGVLLTTGSNLNEVIDNTLGSNGENGVRVNANAGTRNRIQENSFMANVGLAIDINLDGATPNDPGDADTGPNNVQNYPDFDQVVSQSTTVEITYRVNSSVVNATYPLTVDFYVNGSGESGGQFVYRDVYGQTPNTAKTVDFNPNRSQGFVMAMVTDAEGNSSELGAPMAFNLAGGPIFKDGFE